MDYIPTLAGNATYLGIFALLFVAQTYLGIRYKTWGFMIGMLAGIALELVGYAGRIMLHDNIFDNNNFIIYLVGLTIGPAFLTAAIYLCLGRIITIYGVSLSILKPKWITVIFVACDLISLVLQAAGGAITATADDADGNQLGINIMIAGLASQVASIALFIIICAHFGWRVFKNPHKLEPMYAEVRASRRFVGMLFGKFKPLPARPHPSIDHRKRLTRSLAIGLSIVTIFIRSTFRLIELQEGFDGELANNELDFMILEGPMIFGAVILLTVWHPGWVLGASLWVDAGFHLLSSKEDRTSGKNRGGDASSMEYSSSYSAPTLAMQQV